MTTIKRAGGIHSTEHKLAQQTKRRIMMLPFLPHELITQRLVELIVREWRDAATTHKDAFDKIVVTLLRMYVRRESGKHPAKDPVFSSRMWSVCGKKIRTNNAAESVHSRLTPAASGRLSIFRFLKIIENEMNRATNAIHAGCPSSTNPVETDKNNLLAAELEKLFRGKETVLCFLDNCARISQLKTKRDASAFLPREKASDADVEFTGPNAT